MKIEDCRTEADLNKYREKQENKINWDIAIFWFFLVVFILCSFYGFFKAIYGLYKLIF